MQMWYTHLKYLIKKHKSMNIGKTHSRPSTRTIWGESGFFRSNIENINEYFDKYKDIQNDVILSDCDRHLWLFAMYFDFMSHIAQQLEKYREHSQSLVSARKILVEVVTVCYRFTNDKNDQMRNTMYTIIAESYPAIHFIKDTKSDFQVIKPLTWNDFMAGEHPANIKELRQILVDNIKPTPMSMSQSKGN